jgi:probable rRNA maturation factor
LTIDLGIQVDEQFREGLNETRLRRIVERVLTMEGITQPVELGLVIIDDKAMCNLNKRYRNTDAATDVLSFALHEEQPGRSKSLPFVFPPDGVLHLGEVVISYPQAQRQAKEYCHSIEEEIELLAVHGLLHLLGYRDDEPEREQEMRAIEKKVLSKPIS